MSHLTDKSLIERTQGGDFDAFGQLVKRYQGLVFGVAYHNLGDPEGARDVAQQVFIRAFLRLGQVRDASKIGAWLRQITSNECRAWAARHPRFANLEDTEIAYDDREATERRILVEQALKAIDETSRLTMILFYLHAYSIKEIAGFLDEPATTIKSRLRNARTKLRTHLEEALEDSLSRESLPEDFADRVTQLLEAVRSGNEVKTRALLTADPWLVSANEEPGRNSALHIAAGSGDAAVVELLLSFGANPNALDAGDNASPLHHAAERGRLEVIKLLLDAGADIDWDLTIHQSSPLGWATMFSPVQREVATYLIERGAKVDIFSAISLGDLNKVRELVDQDPHVLRRRMSACERYRSPIEFAAERKQFEIASLLIELGSEVGLSDAAALGLDNEVSKRLDEKPNAFNLNYALKAAVMAGQTATARQLLTAGADPNYAPQHTSLIFDSIGTNDRFMSELLIECGADIEFQDSQWKSSALGWQVFFGKPEETQLALDLGSKPAPHLLDLAKSGERGELRRFSTGTAEGYRKVYEILVSQ